MKPLSVLGLYARIDRLIFRTLPLCYARAMYMKANFLIFRKLHMAWPVEVETSNNFRTIMDNVDPCCRLHLSFRRLGAADKRRHYVVA